MFKSYIAVLLRAGDTSILIMWAVFFAPAVMFTLIQASFAAITCHFIHPDGTSALAKVMEVQGLSRAKAQTVAHHVSISVIPAVITHRTPLFVMVHFNSALMRTIPICEADCVSYNGMNGDNMFLASKIYTYLFSVKLIAHVRSNFNRWCFTYKKIHLWYSYISILKRSPLNV